MYCPECKVEYRDGFTECSDCHVPLLPGSPPPDPKSPFEPNLGMVMVLESNEPMAIGMAKGALEEAGIPYVAVDQIGTLMQDINPFLRKWIRIKVASDRETEVRELLDPILHPAPIGPEFEATEHRID